MNSLFFLLALLGVAAVQDYNYTGPSHSHGFNGPAIKDHVWMRAERFIERFVQAVHSNNNFAILKLFHRDSVFCGCNGIYDQSGMKTMLLNTASPTRFECILRSVEDLGEKINCTVQIFGLVELPFIAGEFVLLKSEQQLESGRMNNCWRPVHCPIN